MWLLISLQQVRDTQCIQRVLWWEGIRGGSEWARQQFPELIILWKIWIPRRGEMGRKKKKTNGKEGRIKFSSNVPLFLLLIVKLTSSQVIEFFKVFAETMTLIKICFHYYICPSISCSHAFVIFHIIALIAWIKVLYP